MSEYTMTNVERILLGELILSRDEHGKLWLHDTAGEGMAFHKYEEKQFTRMIADFYAEHY